MGFARCACNTNAKLAINRFAFAKGVNMTRTNILASMLYKTAVSSKNMDFDKLVWKHNREKLIYSLSAMQFITGCIGLKNISLLQAEEITNILSTSYGYNKDDFSNDLKEATSMADYSDEYEEVLFEMHFILSECLNVIMKRKKGYISTISRYIKAFHNYPRVFLSLADKSKISPQDAIEYSKSYLKLD